MIYIYIYIYIYIFFFKFYFLCYSKVQQLQQLPFFFNYTLKWYIYIYIYIYIFFFKFYFLCYSKVQQLQQLQLLPQSIHAQTYYTPKHTCNSTITTQGNAYCYFTSAIQKKKKLIIFSKEEKLPILQSPFVH